MTGAFGRSAYAESVAEIDSTIARLVEIRKQAESVITRSTLVEQLTLADIAEPLPRLSARRLEVQGIIDDSLLAIAAHPERLSKAEARRLASVQIIAGAAKRNLDELS